MPLKHIWRYNSFHKVVCMTGCPSQWKEESLTVSVTVIADPSTQEPVGVALTAVTIRF